MKYKALMLDLDGTTIPIQADGIPSPRVKQAIAEANKKLAVGIATSRPYWIMEYLLEHIKLSAPCIINGGSEILEPKTKKILFRQEINADDVRHVFRITQQMGLTLLIDYHDKHIQMENDTLNLKNALSGYV